MKNITTKFLLFLVILFLFFNNSYSQKLNGEIKFTDYTILPGYGINKMKNMDFFQGNRKHNNYFEGWYFKMVSEKGDAILSVIPGISLNDNNKKHHAFIQVIDGKTTKTLYFYFPIEEFAFSKNKFAIRIGNNYFSEDSLILNIQNDSSKIKGKIIASEHIHLTKKNRKLRIMGWYRFVPFMECYHDAVSLNNKLKGTVKINNNFYNFNNGKGYIEKDWGKSMPSSWIWIQSNHFSTNKTSFMLSVANIPWLGHSFTGFLGFLLYNNISYRFGTYTKAKLQIETVSADSVKIIIRDKKFTFNIIANRNNSGILKAPQKGNMDRRIAESIDAKVYLKVIKKNGEIVFADSTCIAGLEIVGEIDKLINIKK